MSIGKFPEFYVDVTKEATKIPQEQYHAVGRYPIIDQGQKSIAGMWDNPEGLYEKVPAIVFGDHTRVIKYVDTPFFIGADGVKVLRPADDGDNVKYLFYVLQAARIPNLGYSRHFKAVKELEIRMYPRKKQDEIVRVLEQVDSLIGQRQNEIMQIDQLVKSRFVEMFGDPVSNPKGWSVQNFEDISVLITDGEHVTPRRSERGIYLLSARNVLNHTLQLDDVDFIDEEEYCRIARRVTPQEGDVLISCSGSIGRCCVVPANLRFQMVRSTALIRFTEEINPIFAEWLITSEELQHQIAQSATQSSQANLFQGKIQKLHGYVPPKELQDEFAAFVAEVDKSKLAVKQSLEKLETLKKSLMQQYFG